MKADLTRSTFKVFKHYRAVRMQQGRVQLDADWNEQQDIVNHRVETETVDVLGTSGVPFGPGFAITGGVGNLGIGAGRCYVDGLLCENDAATTVVTQPDWPANASAILPAGATLSPLPPMASAAQTQIVTYNGAGTAVPPTDGVYLAYLEVWQRHLTALEDPAIREVALGGPDTATREKTVWQVKLLLAGALGASVDCATAVPAWTRLTAAPTGTLAARSEPTTPASDPCLLSPDAGFRRLENLLYRVEVHDDGSTASPRFKWSRDNGSIVTRVVRWLNDPVADEFEVASIGRDNVLAIGAGCWVEFIDDTHELLGQPGTLVKVLKTAGNVVTVDLGTKTDSLDAKLFAVNPRVRRWDGIAPIAPAAPASTAGWVRLEDGVQIKMAPGTWRVGDWWTVPARTATADVEWPKDAAAKPLFVAPQGVLRAFTRLAVVSVQANTWTTLFDCRELFPSLTDLTNLFYVGGDGQEAMPNPLAPAPIPLPSPLQVAVFNGAHAVQGAKVLFTANQGSFGGAATLTATTGADGVALAAWSLAPDAIDQTARADLLENGLPAPGKYNELRFSARLSTAAQVSYDPADCADLATAGVNTVQAAIDALCKRSHGGSCCVTVGATGDFATLDAAIAELLKRKEIDFCICLLPGAHKLARNVVVQRPDWSLQIHGAGRGTRLDLAGQSLALTGLRAVMLRDFDAFDVSAKSLIRITGCGEIEVDGVRVGGISRPGRSLLFLDAARSARVVDARVTAYSSDGATHAVKLLSALAELAPFTASFALDDGALFADIQADVVTEMNKLSAVDRRVLADKIRNLGQLGTDAPNAEESDAFANLSTWLLNEVGDLATLLDVLRSALLLSRPSFAMAVGQPGAFLSLSNNRIEGRLTLCGEVGDATPNVDLAKLSAAMKAGAITLAESNGDIRLVDNRLREVVMAGSYLANIVVVLNAGNGAITQVPSSIVANGNVLRGACVVIGRDIAYTNNTFRMNSDAGTHIGFNAKYIANFARNDFSLFVLSFGFFQQANEPLNVVQA